MSAVGTEWVAPGLPRMGYIGIMNNLRSLGPEVITPFSCSTQLNVKFQLFLKQKYES